MDITVYMCLCIFLANTCITMGISNICAHRATDSSECIACSSVCAYESFDISACMRMLKYCAHRSMDIPVYMYVYVQVFVKRHSGTLDFF